ncbi:type I secretion system permease/ATPase, partial [Mesorhizobium sp. M7A.F.Ca.CA.002.15.1.1]
MTRSPEKIGSGGFERSLVAANKAVILATAVISGVINVLALTAPLFMLQVYDRVLASHSVPTLVGLGMLAFGLYAFQCGLDIIRARVLLRVGERFDHQLSGRVHDAVVRLPLETRMPSDGLQPLRDLDNVRNFLSGPGPTAFFDLPWMPFYLGLCFLLHFWLGMTAMVGAILLVSLTVITDASSRNPTREALRHNTVRNALLDASRRNAEAIRAMGLSNRMTARWRLANSDYLAANRRASDVVSGLGGVAKTLRLVLQSAILAVGAWLAIEQQVTPGVMIASSIIMGRALAPVELAIGSWKVFLMARQSWIRLRDLLLMMPEETTVLALPKPQCELRAAGITVVPPGETKPTVFAANFVMRAGSALGIIGPSGAGKSTLARALVGAWTPASGKVRIDDASLDQWDQEAIGRHIGYLPQGGELFDGTIAENIARFESDAKPETIVSAAMAAGVHELILQFDKGYEARIGEAGSSLSAGQRQRIGLARALYADPFLVVLDEPNANLDADGEAAVVKAIAAVRERKGIAIVIAHRPSALAAVDFVLMMEAGRVKAFGPRDEVLSKISKVPSPNPTMAGYPGFSVSARMLAPFKMVADPNESKPEVAEI